MLMVMHGVPFPNVVIFMADDMGIGDCSAYQFLTKNPDKEQLHTPAMEKLARMGMLFTDAHAPSLGVPPPAIVCSRVAIHGEPE